MLAGGGWVDPAKVDQAIARWRATTKAVEGEFGLSALLVRLFFTSGGERKLMTAKTSPVKSDNNVLRKTWNITKRGDFEIQVLDETGATSIAIARFRIV